MKRKIHGGSDLPCWLLQPQTQQKFIIDGNKLDRVGEVGRHVWTTTGDGKNRPDLCPDCGLRETQINTDRPVSVGGNTVLKRTALKANSRTRIWSVWLSRV